MGGRGFPPKYGGYCTLFEEIGPRLTDSGDFHITIYCRRSYFEEHPKELQGIKLVYIPVWRNKYLETLLFTACSVVHALFCRFDVLYVVDNGNAPLMWPFYLLGKPTALQTDGLGWKRRKWGNAAQRFYRWTEKAAAALITELVSDSREMQAYYRQTYSTDSIFIPYGSHVSGGTDYDAPANFGLTAGGYFLVVTRIEPDNNTDIIVREYKRAGLNRPLVIVGGVSYPSDYTRALQDEAGPDVIFLGGIYDAEVLNGLYVNAFAYLHGHMVGGTNPALLRGMDGGACCVAIDVNFNREVLGANGLFFSAEEGHLAATLQRLEADPGEAYSRGEALGERARQCYRWDAVADAYGTLFRTLSQRLPPTECYRPEAFAAADVDDEQRVAD
jgi:glycosyltransferase involved in cell wall biosynthesis